MVAEEGEMSKDPQSQDVIEGSTRRCSAGMGEHAACFVNPKIIVAVCEAALTEWSEKSCS